MRSRFHLVIRVSVALGVGAFFLSGTVRPIWGAPLCDLTKTIPIKTKFYAFFSAVDRPTYTPKQDIALGEVNRDLLDKKKKTLEKRLILPAVHLPKDQDATITFQEEGKLKVDTLGIERKKYLLRYGKGTQLRVKPLPEGEYSITIPEGTKLIVPDSPRDPNKTIPATLPKDTPVLIGIPPGPKLLVSTLALALVELPRSPEAGGTTLLYDPDRMPQGGFVTLVVRQPGFDFTKARLRVCFRGRMADPKDDAKEPFFKSTEILVESAEVGEAKLRAQVPIFTGGIRRFDWTSSWTAALADLRVIATAGEGKMVDVSRLFRIPFRLMGLGLAIVALLLAYILPAVFVGKFRKAKGLVGLMNPIWLAAGKIGKASLSLFQIWLWTLVVFASTVYVLFVAGKLIDITEGVLVLLGISGASSLAAKFTAVAREERGRAVAEKEGVKEEREPQWFDLVSTTGRFDLFKFQMLIFTLVTAIFVIRSILHDYSFPEVPGGLLILMGISNGVYLGGKVTTPSPFAELEQKYLELRIAREAYEDSKLKVQQVTEEFAKAERELNEAKAAKKATEDAIERLPDPAQKEPLQRKLEMQTRDLEAAQKRYDDWLAKKGQPEATEKKAKDKVETLQKEFDDLKGKISKSVDQSQ